MDRRALFIGIALFVVAAAGGLLFVAQRLAPAENASSEAPAAETATTPVPSTQPAPGAATPAAPRVTRNAPAAPVETSIEPAAPVEVAIDMGTLRIDSDVPGAQVFIDRQFLGTAPLTAENVKPGRHQLNVSVEGFEGFSEAIDVAPGLRNITVTFREVRLDASIDVIHRHGIGSCRGRLIATPQGLRYETTNRDDSFAAGLLDLDMFQVDYLEKNLRIRVARGRQFNFTDPDGSADRLFVFHRDVERVHERLRNGDSPAQ